jgi:hypothetical protein
VTRRTASAAVVRVAAAVLVIALSGAPGVAALHAPAEHHRCSCKHDVEHECDCGGCRRRSLEARASDAASPPCHREGAKKELEAESRTRKPRSEPCIDGGCGGEGVPALSFARSEPYLVRPVPVVVVYDRAETFAYPDAVPHPRVVAPEPPPPRSA